MEIRAVEQKPRMCGKDLPGFCQMLCASARSPSWKRCAETARYQSSAPASLPGAGDTVSRSCRPICQCTVPRRAALSAAVIDRGVLFEITGNKDRDIGMQHRPSPQRLVAVEDFFDLFEIESPVVKHDRRNSIAIANEPHLADRRAPPVSDSTLAPGVGIGFERLLASPPLKHRDVGEIAEQRLEIRRRPAAHFQLLANHCSRRV